MTIFNANLVYKLHSYTKFNTLRTIPSKSTQVLQKMPLTKALTHMKISLLKSSEINYIINLKTFNILFFKGDLKPFDNG